MEGTASNIRYMFSPQKITKYEKRIAVVRCKVVRYCQPPQLFVLYWKIFILEQPTRVAKGNSLESSVQNLLCKLCMVQVVENPIW